MLPWDGALQNFAAQARWALLPGSMLLLWAAMSDGQISPGGNFQALPPLAIGPPFLAQAEALSELLLSSDLFYQPIG